MLITEEFKNYRSKTYNIRVRNKQWNLFRRKHHDLQPVQISQQVVRHKRLLLSQYEQHQKLVHDNIILQELSHSTSSKSIVRRSESRSQSINSQFRALKKIVEDNQQQIDRIKSSMKQSGKEASSLCEVREELESVYSRIKAKQQNPTEKFNQKEFCQGNQIQENAKTALTLKDSQIKLRQQIQEEKKKFQQTDTKVKHQINQQGRLLREKQKLEQILLHKFHKRKESV